MQGEKCDTIPVVGLYVFCILNYVNVIRTLNIFCTREIGSSPKHVLDFKNEVGTWNGKRSPVVECAV